MIYINLCVDWEGDHFRNLHDLKFLLSKLDENIPVTHFICPSYFYRYPKDAEKKINSILRQHDEAGLHIHCNKPLINNIPGVEFKTEHNYYKKNDPLIQLRDRILNLLPVSIATKITKKITSGRGVPLSVYSFKEIKQIIGFSRKLLSGRLQTEINSFRAGGWLASDDVFDVLNQLNFIADSSAVPPEILSNGFEYDFKGSNKDDFGETYPFFTEYIRNLWGNKKQETGFLKNKKIHDCMPLNYISKKEHPFHIDNIIELPNNLAATDFATTEKTFTPTLNWFIKENHKYKNKKPFFLNLTCHQEGDFYYKKGLLDFYALIKKLQAQEIQFTTVSESAKIFKKNNQVF